MTTTTQPARATWDVVLTIVLGVAGIGLVILLGFLGIFLAFASDSCGTSTCNTDQIGTGMLVAVVAPAALFLVALVIAVVRLVKKRRAFWVILVGYAVAILGWVAGAALVFTAVDGYIG
jgi:uncharacterized BrkB/YihY/UPF0761 family membrane protein